MTALSYGFAPLVGPGASVLILGSLPSQLSLKSGEYYGNPRNAFWKIMGNLFGAGPELPYRQRIDTLVANQVAVWDVLASSHRPGSLDASIDTETARPNDFLTFLEEHPGICLICFNGQAAAKLFARLVEPRLQRKMENTQRKTLPSTSPAYAAINYDAKCSAWGAVLQPVDKHSKRRGDIQCAET